LAMFPAGVSPEGLPSHEDPAASLAPGSPIVLLDLDTGERAPCFAEGDANVKDPIHAALIIPPLARLPPSSHYAGAIRNTVKALDGKPLKAPAGFAALRDGKGSAHPRFDALRPSAGAMFAALEAAGVPRRELVLAWDFVTASDAFLRSDLQTMRQAALA